MSSPNGPARPRIPWFLFVFAPAIGALGALAVLGAVSWSAGLGAAAVAALLAVGLSRNRRAAQASLETALDRARQQVANARRELESLAAGDQAVFTALPDPVILIAADRRILRANPAAREMFEHGHGGDPKAEGRPDQDTLVGRDLTAVLRNPALLQAVDEVLNGAEDQMVEFTLGGPVERYFGGRAARLGGARSGGTAAILTLHDVTGLKRAEQLRADFVANASHELRTPLASILGFIETLQGPAREDDEARERFLAVMHEQGTRMARLVADLLSLSRIEMDEHTPPRDTVDLANLARIVARNLEPQARAKDMTFDFDLNGLAPVIGHDEELTQVLQNLIDNACKYGRAGTPVRIAGRDVAPDSPGGRRLGRPGVALSVADQGDGIAREHLPRLTERFYRADTARSRKLGGTGLGLAIVKHILNRHRGLLEIESVPGEGSSFTILLPRAAK